MHSKQLKVIQRIILVVIFALGLLLYSITTSQQEGVMFYFLDVGQGDASLIVMPNNIQILIDGGPGERILSKVGAYMPFYDRTIEYVILTHAHSDHMDGILEVAQRYKISTFIYNGVEDGAEDVLEELTKQNTKIVIVNKEDELEISQDVVFEILFPDRSLAPIEHEDPNDSSIVARVLYKDTSVLYTGDAPREVERYLVDIGVIQSSNILKIGHHGSKTSSDNNFVRMVNPVYAVISVGKNSYGHPHTRTLSTLKKVSTTVLRTDKEGDIIFYSDGSVVERVNP